MSFEEALDKLLSVKDDDAKIPDSLSLSPFLKLITPSREDVDAILRLTVVSSKLNSKLSSSCIKTLFLFLLTSPSSSSLNPISPIASMIHAWRSSLHRSPSSPLNNFFTPFYNILQEGLDQLPKIKVRKTMSCSFIIPPGFTSQYEESCENYLSETFTNNDQQVSKIVHLDSPVLFTTSTNNSPYFLGSSHHQPALIYRIVCGDDEGIECFDISRVVLSDSMDSLVIPTTPITFKIERSVKIGKKYIVTLKKNQTTSTNEKATTPLCTIPFLHPSSTTSLVASNLQPETAAKLAAIRAAVLESVVGKSLQLDAEQRVLLVFTKMDDITQAVSAPALRSVVESVAFQNHSDVSDTTLDLVCSAFVELKSLNLKFCENVDDMGLQVIASKCGRLTHLNLCRCSKITDSGLRAVASKCFRLTHLDLSICYKITDTGLRAIAALVNLTSLNLTYGPQITDSGLCAIAASLVNLTSLNLESCYNVTDTGFQAVASNLINLTSLDLENCSKITVVGIQAIAAGLTNLTHLNLHRIRNVGDDGVKAIAAHCVKLTSLNLDACREITDDSLEAIAVGLVNLTSLNLEVCKEITDAGVRAIAVGLVNLTSLNLRYCDKITDAGLEAIAVGLINLTSLNLSDCSRITDNGLHAIPNASLVNLNVLKLGSCNKITDNGLQAIAAKLVNLTYLDLGYCEKISNSGLRVIVTNLGNLDTITLTKCDKITTDAKTAAKTTLPKLRIFG